MWKKLTDSQPRQYQAVLVTDGRIITAARFDRKAFLSGSKWFLHTHGVDGTDWEWKFEERDITHWMPLPFAPK